MKDTNITISVGLFEKSTDTNKSNKKLRYTAIDTKPNKEMVSTSVAISSSADSKIKSAVKITDKKVNGIIKEVLETTYDAETNEFYCDIPKKITVSNTNYSVNIQKEHADALNKEAKKRNMTIGEFLSELILQTIVFE